MRYERVWAIATIAVLGLFPASSIVVGEESSVPIPITPADSEGYAVFFADNMAFAPQWRTGNQVRIEVMVLKAGDFNGDGVTNASDIPLDVNLGLTQAELTANPDLILGTYMVSVPEIWVTMSGPSGTYEFYSYFADGTADDTDTVGREINKAGHLIYGFLWDTTGVEPGVYRASVSIPAEYDVVLAIENLIPDEEEDPTGFIEVPASGAEPISGTGGVVDATNEAFIYIGAIVERGSGNGNGGKN